MSDGRVEGLALGGAMRKSWRWRARPRGGAAARWAGGLLSATLLCTPIARGQEAAVDEAATPKAPAFALPDVGAAFLAFEDAWPKDRINPRGEATPGVIVGIEGKEGWYGVRAGRGGLIPNDDDRAGLDAWKAWAKLDPMPALEFEGANAFVPRFREAKDGEHPRTREILLFISGQTRPGAGESILLERAAFLVQDPLQREAGASRGLCLFMPGLFGTPEPIAESMATSLRKSGWTVLRMLAQPSRFTERVEFVVDGREREGGGEAGVAVAIDDAASEIARVLTGRAAECAFAAEAACASVETSRPYLKGKPRIAVGFSAGAMTLPTVVAREAERYRAAVLVGAGCHYWLLNSKSNYATMVGALSINWKGIERTRQREELLAERYLVHAPLDSFHTAAALRGKPVLMVQGEHDLAVPTSLGDVLWERLGKPERWMRPFGHEFLFINLHKDYERMTGWLDGELAPRAK